MRAIGNHVGVGIVVAVLAAIELWLVHRKPPHVLARAADVRYQYLLSDVTLPRVRQ